MRHRFLLSALMVTIAIAALSLIAVPIAAQTPKPAANAAAKSWTPPKTPWGDPDFLRSYTSDYYNGVGLQRDVSL